MDIVGKKFSDGELFVPEMVQAPKAMKAGLTTDKLMTVVMPAGSVEIELKEDGTVVMTGPVETCYAGFLPVTG